MPSDERRLLYSTDGPQPLRIPAKRTAAKAPAPGSVPNDGVVRVGCEKRRAGLVTIVYGLAASELGPVAADLKRRTGTGGSAKDGVVTLQGDKRDVALAYLAERGRRAKRMGG